MGYRIHAYHLLTYLLDLSEIIKSEERVKSYDIQGKALLQIGLTSDAFGKTPLQLQQSSSYYARKSHLPFDLNR